SLATQKRRSCRFGRKRRRVLLLACETLLPVCTPLPVTWHTRDMFELLGAHHRRCLWAAPVAREPSAPPRGRSGSGAQRADHYPSKPRQKKVLRTPAPPMPSRIHTLYIQRIVYTLNDPPTQGMAHDTDRHFPEHPRQASGGP